LKKIILWSMFILTGLRGNSQVYQYFQDSPSADYYDFSWMELTSPSELERKGDELRRFPVESVIAPSQGINSLRLKWKSVSGGDWVAIAAGTDWTEKNLSSTDTMQFWLYSLEGIDSAYLPRVFMEDINNVKTTKHLFSRWCNNLPAGQWVSVKIPMDLFLNAGDPVDFTKIKTIGFAQNTSDAVQHTLLIDNMRVFTGNGTSPVASRPTGLKAEGYDSHVELRWHLNPETYVTGYTIQRSANGVNSFTNVAFTGKDDTLFVDHIADLGTAVTVNYRIMAQNGSGEMSVPSDTAEAATRVFTDDELLNMLQQYTFRYFWDFADPASGMARERNTSGNTITSGGSGFGIMAMLVGIERGFITREQGVNRMQKILTFLESADRFHGAWPHWIDGNTGHVIPFSPQDNGGDLVETGFLVQGLLAARNYFNHDTPAELGIAQKITDLWEAVEWDWYRQNNSNVLYWHWSPDNNWAINMQIRGWNEAAIIYILAIASPTHGVPASLWQNGWAGNSNYVNGKTFYGYKLDVGWDKGGPLFFAHYSFLGFDPRHKKDAYANYYINNRNHTLINRAYCIDNPLNFPGYNENCWGLTASDDPDGYMAHEPVSGRDNGTITPTASLSSMPYTPEESINALKYLYRNLGKKIWGPMGFYDAFNQKRNWYTTSYLAIDQGPIIDMIENYRSQLLWNNFMANPEIQQALDDIGFTEDLTTSVKDITHNMELTVMPNPMGQSGIVKFNLKKALHASLYLNDLSGMTLSIIADDLYFTEGEHQVMLDNTHIAPGVYLLKFVSNTNESQVIKLIIQ
jgi:exo beta-1,2-glucooligosaccharide sophorohydrolase (non-reducing end)